MWAIVLLYLVIIIQILVLIWCISQYYYLFSKNKIGYLPSLSTNINNILIEKITQYSVGTKEYTLVELGAGIGNICVFLAKKFPFKKAIGVEMDFFTVLFGRFYNKLRNGRVEFVMKNVFDYQLPDKSVTYCYLGSTIMAKLYKEGYLKNTLVFSLTFEISGVEATEVIPTKTVYGDIYIYDFRTEK